MCHSPDFGIAGHFIDGIVDVHCILDHSSILKNLDLFGHTSDGEIVTVTVKLNTETHSMQSVTAKFDLVKFLYEIRSFWCRVKIEILRDSLQKSWKSVVKVLFSVPRDNTGAVIEVTGVGEGGQRPHSVVASEFGQTLHKILQLIQVSALIWRNRHPTLYYIALIHCMYLYIIHSCIKY